MSGTIAMENLLIIALSPEGKWLAKLKCTLKSHSSSRMKFFHLFFFVVAILIK